MADAPKIDEVIEEILEFMGDRILVAHNTSFDVPFFNSVLKRLNIEQLENRSLCTNLMTKYMIPNLMNSNLNYMSKVFKSLITRPTGPSMMLWPLRTSLLTISGSLQTKESLKLIISIIQETVTSSIGQTLKKKPLLLRLKKAQSNEDTISRHA